MNIDMTFTFNTRKIFTKINDKLQGILKSKNIKSAKNKFSRGSAKQLHFSKSYSVKLTVLLTQEKSFFLLPGLCLDVTV